MNDGVRGGARSAGLRRFREYPNRTIAIVYDFDGTLSPQSMQEYTVFPELRDKLKELGSRVPYFPGVDTWFDRINRFVQDETAGYVKLRHYVVSSGLREILEGVSIATKFYTIFASQYHYDHFGRPTFADRVITDVSKTQYLFRINKGVEDLSKQVNDHMPESDRPIPFSNMIYIGDGDTDVPSMAVTRKNGGHAFAVFSPGEKSDKCEMLFKAGRVDAYFEANYSTNSRLEIFFKGVLKKMFADIRYRAMTYTFSEEVVRKGR